MRPALRRRGHGAVVRGAAAVARGTGRLTGWLILLVLNLALLGGFAALVLTEKNLILPSWVSERVESRLNAGLQRGRIDLGRIALFVDRRGVPQVSLLDVELFDSAGTGLARLNRVEGTFDPRALLDGRIAPRTLALDGAQVTLRRAADGSFALSFGMAVAAFPGMAAVLAEIGQLVEQPLFSEMETVAIRDITVSVEDFRTARVWQVVGGQVDLAKTDTALDMTLLAEVFNGTDDLARVQLSARQMRGSGGASVTAQISDVAARDIALQSPALAFLGVLDAPISGKLRAALDDDGRLSELAGTLDIGAGAVRPRPDTPPLRFDSARTYFSYDPSRQMITFSEISVQSDALSAEISGHAYLRDLTDQGFPRALVAQLSLSRLRLAPLDLFTDTLSFDQGAADVRLRLSPFSVDIGQLVLSEPGQGDTPRRYVAKGRVGAGPGGWDIAMDLVVPEVPVERALALWPVPLAPNTRGWLGRNITDGMIVNINGALRKSPGARADLAVSFGFRDARLQFLRDMPTLDGASGYASIIAQRFALTVETGQVTPPKGGAIDVAGSVMVVPEMRAQPARGEFTLVTDSSIPALLSLLDQPPLRVLRDSPFGIDMADGRARVTTALFLPLGANITMADVDYDAQGVLEDVRSAVLIPGRALAAGRLDVQASPSAVVVSGAATLDEVPLQASWRMGMAPQDRGKSRVQGQIDLSPATVRRLGLGLPDGMVSGRGRGAVTVDLGGGRPPRLRLTSDLVGIGLRLDALGWSKPAAVNGRLVVEATLGALPVVDSVTLSAAGLEAAGKISLVAGGGLERAVFSRVRLDGWLDVAVTLSGQGQGRPPAIAVSGGTLDFRRAQFGAAGGGAGGGAARGPVAIELDRLIVTEGIALTDFNGNLAAGRSTSGSFTARVNGGAAVRGDLVGGARGVSLRLAADDAGAVLRDAGLVRNGYDGPMELVLNPTGDRGTYDGTLKVGRIRIRDAPAMADLLGAISVVGLLEQLSGDGLVFEQTEAVFRLTPTRLILYRASATGASLGISLDGIYDLASRQVDMQGVISPIYLFNRIGSFLTRPGEGLFGFNFRLKGPAARPAVQVNPLSILTPGMFREIFRRPAPER